MIAWIEENYDFIIKQKFLNYILQLENYHNKNTSNTFVEKFFIFSESQNELKNNQT